jgi:hypothetical protein
MVGRIQRKDSSGTDGKEKKPIKRKRAAPVVSSTGVTVTECYCRKCMKMKKSGEFMKATDSIDSNGFMSICKDCISELYVRIYSTEHTIERALLRVCRMINLKYSEAAITTTLSHLNTQGKDPGDPSVVGIYKSKLIATQKTEMSKRDMTDDFTFREPSKTIITDENSIENSGEDEEFIIYLKRFWGEQLTNEQYAFLESELDRYKKTHKCGNASEESLLRQICFAELDIRECRQEGKSPDGAITRLQQLMKTASIDPAKAAIAGAGKSQETFSDFIATIEQNEPADYYKDKKLFKDFDNIEWYFKKYVTRPLKNFITQSRDFNVEQDDSDSEDDFENITSLGEDSE